MKSFPGILLIFGVLKITNSLVCYDCKGPNCSDLELNKETCVSEITVGTTKAPKTTESTTTEKSSTMSTPTDETTIETLEDFHRIRNIRESEELWKCFTQKDKSIFYNF